MPSWKKVVASGSAASLSSLTVDTFVSASSFKGSFTGSLFGTASWATNFITGSVTSASYAYTASSATNAFQAVSSSYAFTASSAISASNALTASYVPASAVVGLNLSQIATGSVTASVGLTSSSFQIVSGSTTLLYVSNSGNVGINTNSPTGGLEVYNKTTRLWHGGTSFYTEFNNTNEINTYTAAGSPSQLYVNYNGAAVNISRGRLIVGGTGALVSGSLYVSSSVTASVFSGSFTGSLFGTASQAISASYAFTASSAISSSYALTASYLLGYISPFPFTGSAQITGSLGVTGSINTTGNITAIGNITASNASFTGTLTAQTLVVSTISSSIVYSSGSNIFGNSTSNTQTFTGSVNITGSTVSLRDGSFSGSGANLYGIPASGITGLNLSQIATGSVSASVNTTGNVFTIVSGSNTLMVLNSSGSLGIGTTSLTGYSLRVNKAITNIGASYSAIGSEGVIDNLATAYYYNSLASTANTTFTLGNLYHYAALQGTFGASSSVTRQYGFFVDNTLTSATNNYGFYGNIPSGSNRWNLYMSGTAQNFLSGNLGIGSGKTVPTAQLDISGSTLITGSLGVTGPITGSSILSTGTITAQTLVVQTVSSSIIYSSGSNIFGNNIANTQTFTGSMNITGSMNFNQTFTDYDNVTSISGSNVVYSRSTGSFNSLFVKYVATSGSNSRAGETIVAWNSNNVAITDYSTVDLGNTIGLRHTASVSAGTLTYSANTTTAGWNIKSLLTFL